MYSNNTSTPEGLGPRLHLPPPTSSLFSSYQTDVGASQPDTNLANTLPPLNLPINQTQTQPQTPPAKPRNDRWTSEEDNLLRLAVQIYGDRTEKWSKIAACVPGRTNKNCRKRWFHSLDPSLRKGPWTAEEDQLLIRGYQQFQGKWSKIAENIPGRTDDQCAKRWREGINPVINKQEWTEEEDELLRKKFAELGSQWQKIAQFFPGRPGLHCRNRWRKIQRNSQNRKESLTSDEMLPTLEEATLVTPMPIIEDQSPSISTTTTISTPTPREEAPPVMSTIPLETAAIMKEMSAMHATMSEALATSTASSDPSISSLLSPCLPTIGTSRNSVIMEPSTSTFQQINYSSVQTQKVPETEINHLNKPYGCGVIGCNLSFPTFNSLYYHTKSAHPHVSDVDKPYKCAIPSCTKSYKNINGLEYHVARAKGSSHKNDGSDEADSEATSKPYKCSVQGCKNSYKNVNGLQYHSAKHHGTTLTLPISGIKRPLNVPKKPQNSTSRASSNPLDTSNTSHASDIISITTYSTIDTFRQPHMKSSNNTRPPSSNSRGDVMSISIANVNVRPFQTILPRPPQ